MIKLPRKARKASPADTLAALDSLTLSMLSGTDRRISGRK